MKSDNLFLKNISKVLLSNFWSVVVGFLGSFVFPKILSLDAYAMYHTFILYVGYIAILHLGFPSGMVINYAGKDYNKINCSQYKSEMILLLSILLGFSFVFFCLFGILKKRMLFFITLAIIPTGMIGSYKGLLQAWNRFKEYSRMNTFLVSSVPVVVLLIYCIYRELLAETYIWVYLAINWVVTILILIEIHKKVKGVRHYPLFSKANWNTEKTGFLLVVGNYINVLFSSVDKQFISLFFSNMEFAYYSFAISLQSIMTVFITSISQPLFPTMAQGKLQNEDYNAAKTVLLIFGSLSGCAYFAVSIIVKLFISKYVKSLEIVGIYFSIFPAMAVISCLYINLYKIKGKFKTYINTLTVVLMIAIILNYTFVKITKDFTGVAIATVCVYYIWLLVGTKQFDFMRLSIRDILFLAGYIVGFFSITKGFNDYLGIVVYSIYICVITLFCYGKTLVPFAKKIWRMS